MSTKQIKDLLAMNRDNFKGCVEKGELLKILQRLWKQEQRNKENVDNMDDFSSNILSNHLASMSL